MKTKYNIEKMRSEIKLIGGHELFAGGRKMKDFDP